MIKPNVSIIIPVYNAEKYIKQCFDSIVNQAYKNFEVIIIDDGSKDNSGNISDEYAEQDSRFKVYHLKNQGAGQARNTGLDKASGEYIFFVDADDWLNIDAIQKHVDEIKEVDMVIGCSNNFYFDNGEFKYSKIEYYYPANKYLTKDEVRSMYIDIAINGVSHAPHNNMYKRRIIEENQIRFPNTKKYEDLAFNNKYIDKINSLSIIDDSVYNYRVSDLEGVAQKLPSNMFEIFTEVNNNLVKLLTKWNVMDYSSKNKLNSFYITNVASCINNTYNPNLNYNIKERYNYINKIVSNDIVKEACKSGGDSHFVNIISKLINIKAIMLIMLCYRMKFLLRKFVKVI